MFRTLLMAGSAVVMFVAGESGSVRDAQAQPLTDEGQAIAAGPVDFWTPTRVTALRRNRLLYFGALTPQTNAFIDHVDLYNYSRLTQAVTKKPAFINISNEWWISKLFPRDQVRRIDSLGAVPFIHLELKSHRGGGADTVYTLDGIIGGRWDADLRTWALAAKAWRKPLLVQWGLECNGATFWWTPLYNGTFEKTRYGDPTKYDACEKFRDAYKHIIRVFRLAGATNVKWVFHVEQADPRWSALAYVRMDQMYPSEVDVIGTSYYMHEPTFERLDSAYAQMARLSTTKPIMLCEIGILQQGEFACNPGAWTDSAFARIARGRYPRMVAACSWGGNWTGNPATGSLPGSYNVFDNALISDAWRRNVGQNVRWLASPRP